MATATQPVIDDLRTLVLRYLDEHTTLNLATYGPAGLWSAAVLYVHEGVNLYYTSVAKTRHAINTSASAVVTGTINDDCKSWETMAGIQLAGSVARVTDFDERRRIVRAYLAKFPYSAALWHGERDASIIALDPAGHDFYKITPDKLFYADNRYAPGRREELMLP